MEQTQQTRSMTEKEQPNIKPQLFYEQENFLQSQDDGSEEQSNNKKNVKFQMEQTRQTRSMTEKEQPNIKPQLFYEQENFLQSQDEGSEEYSNNKKQVKFQIEQTRQTRSMTEKEQPNIKPQLFYEQENFLQSQDEGSEECSLQQPFQNLRIKSPKRKLNRLRKHNNNNESNQQQMFETQQKKITKAAKTTETKTKVKQHSDSDSSYVKSNSKTNSDNAQDFLSAPASYENPFKQQQQRKKKKKQSSLYNEKKKEFRKICNQFIAENGLKFIPLKIKNKIKGKNQYNNGAMWVLTEIENAKKRYRRKLEGQMKASSDSDFIEHGNETESEYSDSSANKENPQQQFIKGQIYSDEDSINEYSEFLNDNKVVLVQKEKRKVDSLDKAVQCDLSIENSGIVAQQEIYDQQSEILQEFDQNHQQSPNLCQEVSNQAQIIPDERKTKFNSLQEIINDLQIGKKVNVIAQVYGVGKQTQTQTFRNKKTIFIYDDNGFFIECTLWDESSNFAMENGQTILIENAKLGEFKNSKNIQINNQSELTILNNSSQYIPMFTEYIQKIKQVKQLMRGINEESIDAATYTSLNSLLNRQFHFMDDDQKDIVCIVQGKASLLMGNIKIKNPYSNEMIFASAYQFVLDKFKQMLNKSYDQYTNCRFKILIQKRNYQVIGIDEL